MNYKKILSIILLLTIVVLAVIFLSSRAGAQQEVVGYLQERFQQQNIPVTKIVILNENPMQIEITVQSLSNGDIGTPEDSTNVLMVSREVQLANQNGYHIAALVTNLVNKSGALLFNESGPVNDEIMSSAETFNLSKPVLSDEATRDLVTKKLNLYGLALTAIEVSTFEGVQTLTLRVSTVSADAGSHSVVRFIPTLYGILPDVNAQGAQIGLCRVELRVKDDELLFNYTFDVQTGEESWWNAEGFVVHW